MESTKSKFGLLFTIMCNVFIVVIIIISSFLIINYDYPDIITKEEFIEEIDDIGCSLIDMKEQVNSSNFDMYLTTDSDTCSYSITYMVINDREKLNYVYSQIYDDIISNNSNIKGTTNISINSKYYEYSTSGDYYKIGVLNGNSILYSSVDKEYRSIVLNLFNELDYKYEVEFDNEIFVILMILIVIIFIIFFVSVYKIEKKIRNSNVGLIPFYNIWCLSNDVLGSPWYSLLLLVPIGNFVFIIMFCNNMAKVFNKMESYGIGLMLLPTIFLPLLAFDDSVYTKPFKNKKVNKVIKQTKDFKLNAKCVLKIFFDIINWIITILFVPLGLIFLLVFFNSKLKEDMFFGLFFIVLGLMLCPLITKHTKKYKIYRMCKWLIVTLFVIFLFMV